MAEIAEPFGCELADQPDMGLRWVAVRVSVGALVGLAVIGLGVLLLPGQDLIEIDQQVVAVHPGSELGEPLGVVVARHAGVEHVIPTMKATYQVVA